MQEQPAETLLSRLAGQALLHLDDLTPVLLHEIAAEIPELVEDASLRELLAVTVADNLASALRVFATPERTPPPAPAAALEHARRLAQRGIPLSSLLRAYRLGQAAFQHTFIGEIASEARSADTVAAAARSLSSVAFSYVDRISGEVVQAYQNERDYWQRQRIATRAAQLDALLSGTEAELGRFERAVGYVLDQQHVGVVLWADDGEQHESRLPTLERAAAALAQASHCAVAPLIVARDVATVWAWLPAPATVVSGSLPAGVRAAVGRERSGLVGFRESHAEALAAQHVVVSSERSRRQAVTRSDDLGPLPLVCGDLERLRRWVGALLGPLALDDPAAESVRRTLEVFLATGGSYLATGTRLTMHRNTVQYRVRKASDQLGFSVEDRRLDLELALLACRVLGRPVLSHPTGTG